MNHHRESLRNNAPAIGALLLGLLAFVAWDGGHVLSPVHVGWVMSGWDTPTHYLGWEYFRHAPWWQWPVGANPSYGSDAPGTIVLADVVPLLAFALKPFSAWLPADFQYLGFWIFCCFMLQAWFGYRLSGRLTFDPWIRLLGCGFFLASSIFLMRVYLHPALAGQWIVLAALYLSLDQRWRPWSWGVLLVAASLVHAYLLVMAGAIWSVAIAGRALRRTERLPRLACSMVLTLVAVVLVMWAAGYFVPSSIESAPNVGHANLLTPVWTGSCGSEQWSSMLPCLPLTSEVALKSGEGFGYFGLGYLLLVLLALILLAQRRRAEPVFTANWLWKPPLLASLALLAFAFGNEIRAGNHLLLSFRLPGPIERLWEMFRAAPRMEWPMWYLLLLLSLGVVVSRLGVRCSRAALTFALIVQCVDLSGMANHVHRDIAERSHYRSVLKAPAWKSMAGNYKHVVYLSTAGFSPYLVGWIPHYKNLAHYAVLHGMSINTAYLARLNLSRLAAARTRREALLAEGKSEADTFYVVEDAALWSKVLCAHDYGQWHGNIDGLSVLLPESSGIVDLPRPESCQAD
ncbi:DUF6311 domain-containing protein [Rhodanobacter sp. Col0626]|uniref:DUF6311 domain-containing protein n=1 Tax=Rhodanobacter sp. Col0626 TaxID=3415679 RepID=UPI003CFB753D